MKIAPEFTQLIAYTKSISQGIPRETRDNGRIHTSTASFNEIKAEKVMQADPQFFVSLHQVRKPDQLVLNGITIPMELIS